MEYSAVQQQHIREAVEAAAAPTTSRFRKWGMLVVLSLALAIIIIDTTLLNVSLRTIINDLHTDIQSIQWVITAYSLMLAAFTITGGRLGDLFGRKRMFMAGAVIFALGSLLASISTSVGMMIWGEAIIEGIGAALMMPATSSLLVATFKGRERAIAFGVWGGIAAAASAIGPVFGGWLTTHYSWRWGFRINIAVVAILLIGSILIKDSRDREEKAQIDFVGVLLSALGLLSIVFGIIKASTYGWFTTKAGVEVFGYAMKEGALSLVPIFIMIGFVILQLFALWELRQEHKGRTPLVSMKLFSNRQFVSGASTMGILSLSLAGLIFSIPVFLQAVKNLDAFNTGLAMLPMSIALLIAAPFSAAVLGKFFSPKRIIQVGLALDLIAFLALRMSLSIDVTALGLSPGFILFGIGMGMVMAQVNNLTLSAVSVQEAGEASGVNNTLRQVGSTLGSAILGSVLLTSLSTNLVSGIKSSSAIPDPIKQTITDAISKQTSNVEFGSGFQVTSQVPPAIKDEMTAISHQATVDANKTTLAYGAFFVLLGIAASFALPGGKQIEKEESVAARPESAVLRPETESFG